MHGFLDVVRMRETLQVDADAGADGATSMFDALCVLAVVGRSAESLEERIAAWPRRERRLPYRGDFVRLPTARRDSLLLRAICVSRAKGGAIETSDITPHPG